MAEVVNFEEQFARFDAPWSPHLVARMNDYEFKLVKLEGEFVWHRHEHTDETFIVLGGELCIELRGRNIELRPGELYVVPRGVEHRPVARTPCRVLLVEPAGVVNTGDAGGAMTQAVTDLT